MQFDSYIDGFIFQYVFRLFFLNAQVRNSVVSSQERASLSDMEEAVIDKILLHISITLLHSTLEVK